MFSGLWRHIRWHLFWIVPVLILLTWPAWEIAQEVDIFVSRKLQVLDLHRARSLWDQRLFDGYRVSRKDYDREWAPWENLYASGSCRWRAEDRREWAGYAILDSCSPVPDVEDVFDAIGAGIRHYDQCGPNGCRCDGTFRMEVEYDSEYGYPTHIVRGFKRDWTNTRWPLIQLADGVRYCTLIGSGGFEIALNISPR